MATEQRTRRCRLEAAVGRDEECPEDACPFWDPGGAALHGRCAVEELGVLADDGPLASWLLEIREKLAAASSEDEQHAIKSVFHQLLNDSFE
jgi:hypothetical protein